MRRPIRASRPPGPFGTAGMLEESSCCVVTTLGYQSPLRLAGPLVVGAILVVLLVVAASNIVVDRLGEDFGLFGMHPVAGVADLYLTGHREQFAHLNGCFIVDVI